MHSAKGLGAGDRVRWNGAFVGHSISEDASEVRWGANMIHLDNIHPLTDFKRNTAEFRERLRKSGLPAVLTVEGRPVLVVQDAEAYQKMLSALDRVEAIEGIKKGLESMKLGKGRAADEFFADLRERLGLPAKKRA